MNIGCLRNMVAMATFMRFLLTITGNLIDKICYYASRTLNDSKKFRFLTLFKYVLLNILQNVVRSLLSAGGPCLKLDPFSMTYINPQHKKDSMWSDNATIYGHLHNYFNRPITLIEKSFLLLFLPLHTVNSLYNADVGPQWFMTLKWICNYNDFMLFRS